MSGINRSRQSDLFRPQQALSKVTVIGLGGIGSPTALILAKMGAELTILDFDTVEEHNLASQLYRREDVGLAKVDALAAQLESYAGAHPETRNERYVDQPLSGLVIAAVDSMEVRKQIWEQVRLNPAVDLFIDTRMGGLVGFLLTARPCNPNDIRWYEKQLFPSSEAASEACTARAIAFNSFGIAAMVAATVRRWWVEGERHPILRMDWGCLNFLPL